MGECNEVNENTAWWEIKKTKRNIDLCNCDIAGECISCKENISDEIKEKWGLDGWDIKYYRGAFDGLFDIHTCDASWIGTFMGWWTLLFFTIGIILDFILFNNILKIKKINPKFISLIINFIIFISLLVYGFNFRYEKLLYEGKEITIEERDKIIDENEMNDELMEKFELVNEGRFKNPKWMLVIIMGIRIFIIILILIIKGHKNDFTILPQFDYDKND